MSGTRYICVHGHFYQPPRENPWLEAIESQDSAYPHHDWNERITFECYAPNARSRILDAEDRIARIVSNYERISFNFGPTLLSWMERAAPRVYGAILAADRASRERRSGHGNAIAQVYNHMILPLANRRDRRTQVRWGIRDFEHRFGRSPEGMWLAETAVDLESLDILAKAGLRFTILGPEQALRARRIGAPEWEDVSGGRVDPRVPYAVSTPSGRKIAVFFYDGPISRGIAFGGLLGSGESLRARLVDALDGSRENPQIVHAAADGETYGHHQRHGDMALAWALCRIEEGTEATLTNYGEYLARHPPTWEAEIVEKSSWSCAHGIDRWWSDCGCSTGSHPGWSQAWRTPLRDALDGLRDRLKEPWAAAAGALLKDPWRARDGYIDVILDRSPDSRARFFAEHGAAGLDVDGRIRAGMLLELQRHAMLMYTSCGWFFDDLSGIETVQVLQYAGRVVQLARQALGIDPEPALLDQLARARSNLPEEGDGARLWERRVRPANVDLPRVAAHFAIRSLFEEGGETARTYCYAVEPEEMHHRGAGRARLVLGQARFTSELTGETQRLRFGALHLGDHHVQGAVGEPVPEEEQARLVTDAVRSLDRGELATIVRMLDQRLGGTSYSLESLFRDEQRKIVEEVLGSTIEQVEAGLRRLHEEHAPLIRFLAELGAPLPRAMRSAAEFVINTELRRGLQADEPEPSRLRELLAAAVAERVDLDAEGIAFAMEAALERAMERLASHPDDPARLARAADLSSLLPDLPMEVNLWRIQNLFWDLRDQLPVSLSRDLLAQHLRVRP